MFKIRQTLSVNRNVGHSLHTHILHAEPMRARTNSDEENSLFLFASFIIQELSTADNLFLLCVRWVHVHRSNIVQWLWI